MSAFVEIVFDNSDSRFPVCMLFPALEAVCASLPLVDRQG